MMVHDPAPQPEPSRVTTRLVPALSLGLAAIGGIVGAVIVVRRFARYRKGKTAAMQRKLKGTETGIASVGATNTYGFRIKCYLPATRKLIGEKTTKFSVDDSDNKISLFVHAEPKLSGHAEIVFLGQKHFDKASAEQIGRNLKHAAMLASLELRLGIDAGQDRHVGMFGGLNFYAGDKKVVSTPLTHNPLEGEQIVLDNVHGLVVYPDRKKVLVLDSHISAVRSPVSVDKFVEAIKTHYKNKRVLSPQQLLAVELYSASYFESSVRARFLTLITVIEALVKPQKLSKAASTFVDGFISKVRESDLSETEKEDLKNRLSYLKRESISLACRNLVARRLGENGTAAIKKYYGLRSDIVHNGRISDKVDLVDVVEALDIIVSATLLYEIYNKTGGLTFKKGHVPGFP